MLQILSFPRGTAPALTVVSMFYPFAKRIHRHSKRRTSLLPRPLQKGFTFVSINRQTKTANLTKSGFGQTALLPRHPAPRPSFAFAVLGFFLRCCLLSGAGRRLLC